MSDPTYTIEEQRTLTVRLEAITARVHAGEIRERRLDIRLLCDLHAALFETVRSHAGRMREPGRGSEYLTFGPQRSSHRDDVHRELGNVFDDLERRARTLDEASKGYELKALELAVKAHADIIRVHPFEDGNGRTSRLCMNHLLVQFGLHPIAIEAVKQEYTEALNHYFAAHDLCPLRDLFIRLYPVGR